MSGTEAFLDWLEQQHDRPFAPCVHEKIAKLLGEPDTALPLGFSHLPQPPFVFVPMIRKRMVERVAEKLE